VWSRRLPHDFDDVRLALSDPATRVQLIVCSESRRHVKPYHVDPIVIPPLSSRPDQIARIVDEYADEAAEFLCAQPLQPARRSFASRRLTAPGS
jgi:hypothetical protein